MTIKFKNYLPFSLGVLLPLFLMTAKSSFAEYTPLQYPSCNSVSGTIVANYSSGDHAIVGIEGLKQGSDVVYSIGNSNFVQCYCPLQEAGIQTNWLAAGSISKEDLNNLITQGWILIPNGTDWGLDPQPYLAKNMDFSCNGGSVQESSSTSGSSGGSGGGSSSSGGSSGGQGGGEVLGISALAPTQNPNTKYYVLLSLSIGLLLIAYGYKIQKK